MTEAEQEEMRQIERLTATKNDLISEEQKLKDEIAKYEFKIDLLSEDMEKKRADMNSRFRDLYAEKFKKLDIKKALIFGGARHMLAIGDMAKFFVAGPTGLIVHAIAEFEKTEQGKLNEVELVLLSHLVGAQLDTGPEQDFSQLSMKDKLNLVIRPLPPSTATVIAEEAKLMQSYVRSVLESKMGN